MHIYVCVYMCVYMCVYIYICRHNQEKMLAAEEMLREIEIREKKKLAQALEEKAKALANNQYMIIALIV